MKKLVALLLAVLTLSGCAAIPTQTSVSPINRRAGSAATAEAAPPVKDLDPLSLVRGFVDATSNPAGDYAQAKAYLTADAAKAWNTKDAPTIIETAFNTVPGEEPDDPDRRAVQLQGKYLGRLVNDGSFTQTLGDLQQSLEVVKDDAGQWRIATAPAGVFMPLNGFQSNYRRVVLYFYTPDFSVLVPDPRYVVVPPAPSIPRRVTELLLNGPADSVRGALVTAIPNTAQARRSTQEGDDGALEVDLKDVGDLTPQLAKQIVAQVVQSLSGVTTTRVKVMVEGQPISAEQAEWRVNDVDTGEAAATPDAELRGLAVSGGRVLGLADGQPIAGPAGEGDYNVLSAAQSLGGSELAVVATASGGGVRLLVGGLNDALNPVELTAREMTRPTWVRSGRKGDRANEVWTSHDGTNVVRVVRTDTGWAATAVNADALSIIGQQITELRLSRDGTRVAAVINGKIVLAAVVRAQDGAVTLKSARTLQGNTLGTNVLSLDWLAPDVLVVSTSLPAWPIAKVNIDGMKIERYNTSNLTVPVSSVSAAPARNVVAVDRSGLWSTADIGDVWRQPGPLLPSTAKVFYPG
ncbi:MULTISPECIES: LpqB family beta-propeller domain-containing protein [Actinosynnema]|uniref:LpqB family beta-propeller domain-containing protein n=1 Tax=Actinosynnema TaxID=40566 RepID=UPI0020A40AA9|nr:LpqB family beta-propeller domain-containing protein [Actinosynnema pretiosum]MCP2097888.1 Sporulation and spore germination [Actinosynnema pretiosum]